MSDVDTLKAAADTAIAIAERTLNKNRWQQGFTIRYTPPLTRVRVYVRRLLKPLKPLYPCLRKRLPLLSKVVWTTVYDHSTYAFYANGMLYVRNEGDYRFAVTKWRVVNGIVNQLEVNEWLDMQYIFTEEYQRHVAKIMLEG